MSGEIATDVVREGRSGQSQKKAGRPRLEAITYMRAIAILLIVAGHSYALAGVQLGSDFDNILSDLIKGATALFVFISGFLFDHVFGDRYSYRRFVLDRAKRLLVPYCVLTIIGGFMFSKWAVVGL